MVSGVSVGVLEEQAMRTLVSYVSRTGNTRKVAEAIFDGITGDKDMKELGQVESLDGYDLTFVGFPIEERFSPAEPAATFLRRPEVAGRPIALFITHGASDDLPELQGWLDNCAAAASQLELVGVFHCQGELSEQMAQKMLLSKDERVVAWAKTRESGFGKPDAASLQRARRWASEMMAARRP